MVRRARSGDASRFFCSFKSLEFRSLLVSFCATARMSSVAPGEPLQTWMTDAEVDEQCRDEGGRPAKRPKSVSRREATAHAHDQRVAAARPCRKGRVFREHAVEDRERPRRSFVENTVPYRRSTGPHGGAVVCAAGGTEWLGITRRRAPHRACGPAAQRPRTDVGAADPLP